MSALQLFMSGLLQSHDDSIGLVVDNARITARQASTRNSTMPANGSTHSRTRWGCDEPPTLEPHKGTSTSNDTVEKIPALHRRTALLVYNNSGPTCPMRKLSPRAPSCRDDVNSTRSVSTASCSSRERRSSQVSKDITARRPPLSPRKTLSNAIFPPNNICPTSKAALVKKKNNESKASRPNRRLSKPAKPIYPAAFQPKEPLSVKWKPPRVTDSSGVCTGRALSISHPESRVYNLNGDPEITSSESREQAPVPPIRRPSAQPEYDSPDQQRLSDCLETSFTSNSTPSVPASFTTTTTEPPIHGRDIYVHPNTPNFAPTASTALADKKEAKAPMHVQFFQRLTKRR